MAKKKDTQAVSAKAKSDLDKALAQKTKVVKKQICDKNDRVALSEKGYRRTSDYHRLVGKYHCVCDEVQLQDEIEQVQVQIIELVSKRCEQKEEEADRLRLRLQKEVVQKKILKEENASLHRELHRLAHPYRHFWQNLLDKIGLVKRRG